MKINSKSRFSLKDLLRRWLWTGQLRQKDCTHRAQVLIQETDLYECRDCLASGDAWFHLRLCMACGYVGCCENSKNKHALTHFEHSTHPIVRSIEPDEDWMWCYADEAFLSPE
ncbi:MAG: hypothetical protein DWQ07_13605 [Chloroflexi bacterium]|nr:MAG: hypothetical protein DWQ07_13605 [Chloroflexota bacterium]MBL1197396.1 hypothetical protein [Chloroflexota bacterium]NOH14692.1 UBP-type zinc finger domain-containing protein [Chloroflexota bacterium]